MTSMNYLVIHVEVDALGNPVRLLLTAGQASEYNQFNALIEGLAALCIGRQGA